MAQQPCRQLSVFQPRHPILGSDKDIELKQTDRQQSGDSSAQFLTSTCSDTFTLFNGQVLEELKASDDRHCPGQPSRPLEGIPYTVMNSFTIPA